MATKQFLSKLDDIAKQAFGHFFLGWDAIKAPAILQPYTYGYVSKQHGSAYSEFSQYLLDSEGTLNALSKQSKFDEDDMDYIKEFNKECDQILAAVDEEEQDENISKARDLLNQFESKTLVLFPDVKKGDFIKSHDPRVGWGEVKAILKTDYLIDLITKEGFSRIGGEKDKIEVRRGFYFNEKGPTKDVLTVLKDLVWLLDTENARLSNFGTVSAARDAIKGIKGYDPLTELKRLVRLIEKEDDLLTTFKEFEAAKAIAEA